MSERLSVEFRSLQFEDLSESDRVLRGGVMAIEGEFADGRGAFNKESLSQISRMANGVPKGLKARFGHPSILADGLGRFLGRWRDTRMGTAFNHAGDRVNAVRGNLHLDESSFNTPYGDLGGYVLRVAASDSDAISSSLVITPKRDGAVWFPEALWASDIVEEGDAVAGLLERGDALRGKVKDVLGRAFEDDDREAVEAFFAEFLAAKFGEPAPASPTPVLDMRRQRMEEMRVAARKCLT